MPSEAQPTPHPERRPYTPPHLVVHGTLTDLTSSLPEQKAGASDIF